MQREGFRLLGKYGVSVFRQAFYTELNEEMARGFGPDNEKKPHDTMGNGGFETIQTLRLVMTFSFCSNYDL